jgi:hypothetical protein
MASRQRGMSKNQVKKRNEQNSESEKKKAMIISTDFDFMNMAIVGIEKNNGFCFEGKIIYTKHAKKYESNVKVLHARGKSGKHVFLNSRSKLGLVSLSSITLPHSAIGVVEEWITPNHLSAYLSNGLITEEDYAKFVDLIGKIGFEEKGEESGGFIFDENAGASAACGGGDGDDREISIDDI